MLLKNPKPGFKLVKEEIRSALTDHNPNIRVGAVFRLLEVIQDSRETSNEATKRRLAAEALLRTQLDSESIGFVQNAIKEVLERRWLYTTSNTVSAVDSVPPMKGGAATAAPVSEIENSVTAAVSTEKTRADRAEAERDTLISRVEDLDRQLRDLAAIHTGSNLLPSEEQRFGKPPGSEQKSADPAVGADSKTTDIASGPAPNSWLRLRQDYIVPVAALLLIASIIFAVVSMRLYDQVADLVASGAADKKEIAALRDQLQQVPPQKPAIPPSGTDTTIPGSGPTTPPSVLPQPVPTSNLAKSWNTDNGNDDTDAAFLSKVLDGAATINVVDFARSLKFSQIAFLVALVGHQDMAMRLNAMKMIAFVIEGNKDVPAPNNATVLAQTLAKAARTPDDFGAPPRKPVLSGHKRPFIFNVLTVLLNEKCFIPPTIRDEIAAAGPISPEAGPSAQDAAEQYQNKSCSAAIR